MCLDFCKSELDLPYDFKDNVTDNIAWKDLVNLFDKNPQEIFNEVEKHLKNWFDRIPPHTMRKGDILIISGGNRKTPSIFVGNNKILITTEKGVKVVSLKGIRIVDTYRARKEPRKITTKATYQMGEGPKDLELIDEESFYLRWACFQRAHHRSDCL